MPGGAGCAAGAAGDAGAMGAARRLSASARRPAAAGQLWLSASTRLLSKSDSVGQEAGDEGCAGGGGAGLLGAGLVAAAERMRSILERLHVDEDGIVRNLSAGVRRVLAEPLYILLAAGGVSDAHEQLRQLTLAADESGTGILDAARARPELWEGVTRTYRELTGDDPDVFFADPAHYIGRAAERTRAISAAVPMPAG